MKLMRLLASDSREGFASIARWLVATTALMAALTGYLAFAASGSGIDVGSLTLGDFIGSMMGGMAIFRPEQNMPFILPVAWLLLVFAMLFMPLSYPYRNLMGFGLHEMVSSGGRMRWWVSKCLWLGLYVLVFWGILLAVACAATAICSGNFSLSVTQDAGALLLFDTWDYVHAFAPTGVALFVPVAMLMSWALCLLQFSLALWIRSVLGYAVNVSLLFTSAFFFNALLPGQYLMLARSALLINSGVSPALGACLALVLGVAASVVGGWRFLRMDIIDKEFSS